MSAFNHWEDRVVSAIKADPSLQTWSNHLNLRVPELRLLAKHLPERTDLTFLELGCGNGLASTFFSPRAEKIIATDIPDINPQLHSIGFTQAEKLIQKVSAKNVELLACSAESIPIADNSIDVVFSIYCLEHVPDKNKCFQECYRILKPGGLMISLVPSFALSTIYPLNFYSYLFKRIWEKVKKKKKEKLPVGNFIQPEHMPAPIEKVRDWATFKKSYPHFPLPTPHGAFPSFFSELWYQRPKNWRKQCAIAGFRKVSATPVSVLPRGILEAFLGEFGNMLYFKLRPIDDFFSKSPLLVPIAQEICLLAEK